MNSRRRRRLQRFAGLVLLTTLLMVSSTQAQADGCASLQRSIKETYNFSPAKLSEDEKTAKSAAMDRVWDAVKNNRATLLPCLRAAVADRSANSFFRFDGSNLLLSLDPSRESKLALIDAYTQVDLGDVNLRVWVGRLALMGVEGFDVSEASDKWLRFPNAFYFLPEHGAYKVTVDNGALFLFGSMDEAHATPALLKIVSDKSHPGRETALWALMNQATPESLQALKQINPREFSPNAQKSLNALLTGPVLVQPRAQPGNTRQEFVTAFESLLAGNGRAFLDLVSRVPDGEKDVVAVLKPEDLPLVRKVRRRIIANGSQHSIQFYNSFTSILMAFIWKPALTQ
ncbi:MAG TPA: HEAT repeat domain-containing protein [Pyrinomonadaceae bacterium]|nr:HEAT repeat domain-containing protein [Pyrinomonadaceae bacterium]